MHAQFHIIYAHALTLVISSARGNKYLVLVAIILRVTIMASPMEIMMPVAPIILCHRCQM